MCGSSRLKGNPKKVNTTFKSLNYWIINLIKNIMIR